MKPFEFEGVSGVMRSSNHLDDIAAIAKEAENARQEAQATFDLDEHIRKIVREELERWEKQLESRLRMNAGPIL